LERQSAGKVFAQSVNIPVQGNRLPDNFSDCSAETGLFAKSQFTTFPADMKLHVSRKKTACPLLWKIQCGIEIMKNITPLILSLSLMILICIVSFMRLCKKNIWGGFNFDFDVLFVCIYLIWMILESDVSKKETKKGNKIHDCGTCEIYAFGQALTILSALWFNSIWAKPNLLHLTGFSLFLGGIFYRLWAVNTLGKYYSHIVREVSEHKIIKTGPYQHIRHPAYAGMIIANIGIVIYFFNWITFFTFSLILFPAIILRIYIEEKTLFNIDGYFEFAKTRKRILPLIW